MSRYWWKDLLDRNHSWQGLELHSPPGPDAGATIEMRSGHHGRMTLSVREMPLFWASMLNDHSGVWLVFNEDHPDQHALLPPVTSQQLESIQRGGAQAWTAEWCRYFARQLFTSPTPLLPARRCLLRPMSPVAPATPYSHQQQRPIERWRFQAPASAGNMGCDWTLYGEDFPDLTAPQRVLLVDWWWGGNLLLGRYPIQPETGRLKWWRKKSREGSLPPILVWHIAGLASYVILDGHYRLQAAMEEGIPPQFIVLSELSERHFVPDAEHQARVQRALEVQQRNNPNYHIDSANQTLINLYDTRDLYASTHSRAVLGDGESWAKEVKDYLYRHQAGEYLEKILHRIA
ncbi:hypothetical protein N5923_02785 [Erwiniaceae bacterium BAC15a-03b]|uniref:Uncharacterized protein n=1 Tax=Winslowiella arboricola TaxID=2978220 RepID=A0A9J6PQU7_9GAMM|nr:hypothetical protein [Winslowiella arboricola]MCU5771133.1 hypothetical protein [Winslowiella arboricola]MCU5776423.1 hypothetical protein [Winslowiella arboricola]